MVRYPVVNAHRNIHDHILCTSACPHHPDDLVLTFLQSLLAGNAYKLTRIEIYFFRIDSWRHQPHSRWHWSERRTNVRMTQLPDRVLRWVCSEHLGLYFSLPCQLRPVPWMKCPDPVTRSDWICYDPLTLFSCSSMNCEWIWVGWTGICLWWEIFNSWCETQALWAM